MKLNFSELTGEKPVWVLNKTGGTNRGPVMFGVVEKNSTDMNMITVPDTFIPINLVEYAERDQLEQSRNLREAVELGLLELVQDDAAQKILSMPGARREIKRISRRIISSEMKPSARMAESARSEEAADAVRSISRDIRRQMATQEGNEAESKGRQAKRFHKRVERVEATVGTEDEVDLINMLRAVLDELKIRDLKRVAVLAKRAGKGKILKWARSRLRERRDAQNDS